METGDKFILDGKEMVVGEVHKHVPTGMIPHKHDPLYISYEDSLAEIQANINLYFMLQYGGKR